MTGYDVFCKNCGAKLDVDLRVSGNTAASVPPRKSHLGLILGIVGGVVVVSAVALVLFLTGMLSGGKVDISDIEGKWYSRDTMIDFDDDGTLRIVTDEETINGEFTYDTDRKEGSISSDVRDYDDVGFELERDVLIVDDVEYCRDRDDAEYGEDQSKADVQLGQQIVGMWHVAEADVEGISGDVTEMGMGFNFEINGTMARYEDYEEAGTGTWLVMDSVLQLLEADEVIFTIDSIVMDPSGDGFTANMSDDEAAGRVRFVKTDREVFGAEAMRTQIQGFWIVCGTSEEIPTRIALGSQGMALMINASTIDFYYEFEINVAAVAYEFIDADTIELFDDSEYDADLEFKTVGAFDYLAFHSLGETLYLAPWDYDAYVAAGEKLLPNEDTRYTSDADIRSLIVREWSDLCFMKADGKQVEMVESIVHFYSDGSFETEFDGEYDKSYWTVSNGILEMEYPDDGIGVWPVFIEYNVDMHAYLLYWEKYDDDQQPSGEYFVFIDE